MANRKFLSIRGCARRESARSGRMIDGKTFLARPRGGSRTFESASRSGPPAPVACESANMEVGVAGARFHFFGFDLKVPSDNLASLNP